MLLLATEWPSVRLFGSQCGGAAVGGGMALGGTLGSSGTLGACRGDTSGGGGGDNMVFQEDTNFIPTY